MRSASWYSRRLRRSRWVTQGRSIGYCAWAWRWRAITWRKCELADTSAA